MTLAGAGTPWLGVHKAVILAGGYGTRLMEETETRPKPMVEIGGMPILWHIMKVYAASGITDFVLPLGYKGHMIKRYFFEYHLHAADVTIDLATNERTLHKHAAEPWRVTLVDTGLETMTGGRVKRLREHLEGETFCLTYGDGVAALDIQAVARFHAAHGRIATVTAVRSRASARLGSSAARSRTFTRSRRAARSGSTAASSCSPRGSSTTSRMTRPCSSVRP